MQLFKNKYFYTLLVISITSHWYVFFDFKVLNAGDWVYVPPELLKNLLNYTVWNSHKGLGEFSSVPPNVFIYYLSSFLYRVASFFTWQLFTRIFFIIPIVLALPFVAFKAFYSLSKNNLIAFISSALYMFNAFFLKLQLDFLTYALSWFLLPLQYVLIDGFLNTRKFKYLIFTSIVSFVFISVELRLFIVSQVFFLFFYLSYFFGSKNKRAAVINIIILLFSVFIGLLPHLGWVVTTALSSRYEYSIPQNGIISFNLFPSYHTLSDAFTLRFYGWQGNLVLESFIRQPTELRFLLILLFFVVGVFAYVSIKGLKKYLAYWLIFSSLLFGLLVSQTNPPFGDLYKFLFDNFPLMKLYRESSKFFLPLAFSISALFGFGLYYFYSFLYSKLGKAVALLTVLMILFFTSFYNLENFFTQRIGGMVRGQVVDPSYQSVSSLLSQDTTRYYRVLWVPVRTRFGYYNTSRPFINSINLYDSLSKEASLSCTAESSLSKLTPDSCSREILDSYSIKYIVVPKEEYRVKRVSLSDSEVVPLRFEHYGSRDDFVSELDNLPYLKKLEVGIVGWDIYINESFNDHVSSIDSKVTYIGLKPHYYRVTVADIKNTPIVIEFSDRYNPGWVLKTSEADVVIPSHYPNDYGTNTFEVDITSSTGDTDNRQIELELYYEPSRYFVLFTAGFTLIAVVTTASAYTYRSKLGLS